jgi:hypothetical protein
MPRDVLEAITDLEIRVTRIEKRLDALRRALLSMPRLADALKEDE